MFERAASVRALAALAALLGLAACGDSSTDPVPDTLDIPEGCSPLYAEGDCLLPYPSDLYRVMGEAGFEVRIPEAAWVNFDGAPVDMVAFHRPDGFSVGTPILALLPGPVDPEGLVFWTEEIERSLDPDSPTVIIDAETGERVIHFAELDPRAADVPERQALVIHPLDRLADGRRYVVAIRALAKTDGAPVEAPPGFASLRDEAGKAHPSLEALSPHYENDVFPVLEGAGVARSGLVLAWDFTTRSQENVTRDLVTIRDDVLATFQTTPPAVTVVDVETDPAVHIAKRIHLTIEVPLYVDSPEPGGRLNVGPDGAPISNGIVDVPVTVWIPPSVANRAPGTPPARLLQYGHGFFGTRDEVDDFAAQLADEEDFVVVAADWWGMSAPDREILVGDLAGDPENTMRFTDRVHQGMANFLALAKAAQGPIALLPELDVGGTPAYDATAIYFYGISNGHILGGTYVGLSPDIERAVLEVGGANVSLMLFRARPFAAFLAIIEFFNQDKLDHQKFGAFFQSSFDRIDPMTYVPYVISEPLPGGPTDRKILMHVGIADAAVPNLASYLHARMLGLPVLEGASALVPIGLTTVAAPTDGSAVTIFDFGLEPTVIAMPPPGENEVHEGLRATQASKTQVSNFLKPGGMIENTCSGVCDPE